MKEKGASIVDLSPYYSVDERYPLIQTRWHVIEVRPAYTESGYYGQSFPERSVKVSPYFDTQDEAVAWTENYEPDKGKFFSIKRENLRRFTEERWVSF